MKTYLEFSHNGEITEIKTKDKLFDNSHYDYNYIHYIVYNKYNFILLYNKENDLENITKLPFFSDKINGKFILITVDINNNLKSFTEKRFLNLIDITKNNDYDYDYSSDDFNLTD